LRKIKSKTKGINPKRIRLRIFLLIFLAILILGTIGFMAIENRSVIDAFYFIIVTVATVGYGDVHPVTPLGKLFTVILIILGVGTFLGVIANATEMMLSKREKQVRMEKLNMVIGVFFSEVGTQLIKDFVDYDPDFDEVRKGLIVTEKWTHQDFLTVSRHLRSSDFNVEVEKADLQPLASFLVGKRDFLVRLLENPILLEHESFTELLRAVFHLVEELDFRDDLRQLPPADKMHIGGDIKRVYHLLVDQWLDYMEHLKDNYPYLFNLAMRTNPFDRKASVTVV
jgi:voltage-gated potassium channel